MNKIFCFYKKSAALLPLSLILLLAHPAQPRAETRVSLNKYTTQNFLVPNPVDLSRLALIRNKTFQITNSQISIQFYFNEQDVYGVVLKRDRSVPLFMRWCFFRSCATSPYDYTSLIAAAEQPPFEENYFFQKFPNGIQYEFQGLFFFTPGPPELPD